MKQRGILPIYHRFLLIKRLLFFGLALVLSLAPGCPNAQDKVPDNRIRVQLMPVQQTTLSSELAANISNFPLQEGESFDESQTLAEFDCSILNAQLNKSEATAEAARQSFKVNSRLAELNSISSLDVDQARAKVKETEAEVSVMQASVAKCSLKAPFAGRIAKLHVEPYQYVTPGKPLMDIVNTLRLEVKLIVPSRWLSWLRIGNRFMVQIEELGRSYPVRLIRIGARIDPLSQSVPLTGGIDGDHAELLPGMSGWASFDRTKR